MGHGTWSHGDEQFVLLLGLWKGLNPNNHAHLDSQCDQKAVVRMMSSLFQLSMKITNVGRSIAKIDRQNAILKT